MNNDRGFVEAVPGEETKLIIWTTEEERNRSGWSSERVWVTCVAHRLFRIDNHLWRVGGLSYGDLVHGTPCGEVYQFTNLAEKGGWWNVVCEFGIPVDVAKIQRFCQEMREMGAQVESAYNCLKAIGIPPTVGPGPILDKLCAMEVTDRFRFQVSNGG